jgi:hypothetical protein
LPSVSVTIRLSPSLRARSASVRRWDSLEALHVQEREGSAAAVGGGPTDDYKVHRLVKTPRVLVLFVDVDTQRPGREALGVRHEQLPCTPSTKVWVNEQPLDAIGRVAEKTYRPALIVDEHPPIDDSARKLLGDKRPKCFDVVLCEKGMCGTDGALPQREHGIVIRSIGTTQMEVHRDPTGSLRFGRTKRQRSKSGVLTPVAGRSFGLAIVIS